MDVYESLSHTKWPISEIMSNRVSIPRSSVPLAALHVVEKRSTYATIDRQRRGRKPRGLVAQQI